METDEVAVMLGDGGGEIVVPELAGHATHSLESVEVAAHEGLEALTVGELYVELAAVALDQAEGIEFARMALVQQRAEVAPVDFKAFPGRRFHAYVGTLGRDLASRGVQMLFQDAHAAVEPERTEPLRDHHGAGGRVLGEPFGDGWLKRVQLAGPLPCRRPWRRRLQVLGQRAAADMQMPGDLARRPVLGPVQAMNGIDLVRGQHLSDARYNGKLVGSP